mmetsp:Transcript_102106/g.164567  ORF Transcript_102106/g.164567 Transcript_102106/m.164567 type:complete len:100 (-) Transcript_102106:111-410(-)
MTHSYVCHYLSPVPSLFLEKVFQQRNFPLPKKYLQGHYRRDWKSTGQPVCPHVEKHGKHFMTWDNTTSRAAEQDDKIGKMGPNSVKFVEGSTRPLQHVR